MVEPPSLRLDSQTRQRLMERLRWAGVNDTKIGLVVGLSRERVGQLLGRRLYHPEQREERELEDAVKLEQGLLAGQTRKAVAQAYEWPVQYAEYLMDNYLDRERLREQLRQQRIDQLTEELKTARQELARRGMPLTGTYLMRYYPKLYNRAQRYKGIPEWRQTLQAR